jgi:hypothetical protein
MEDADRTAIQQLISDATKVERGKLAVPSDDLRSIKRLVRVSEANVLCAFQLLTSKLKAKNSHVRYLALLIVDELFCRSKHLRSLLSDDFQSFVRFTVGTESGMEKRLPPPVNMAVGFFPMYSTTNRCLTDCRVLVSVAAEVA